VVHSKHTSLLDGPDILEVLAAISDKYSFNIIKALKSTDMRYDFSSIMEELKLSKRQLYTKIAHLSRVGIVRRNKRVYHLTSFGKVIFNLIISLVESSIRIHSKLTAIDAIGSSEQLNKEEIVKLINTFSNTERVREIIKLNYSF
jgi:DNA-binding HxlR family transcriptional regulator